MTKRKPLEWTVIDDEVIWPDCHQCGLWLAGSAEAIDSVSIEMPIDVKRIVDRYHANRHSEVYR